MSGPPLNFAIKKIFLYYVWCPNGVQGYTHNIFSKYLWIFTKPLVSSSSFVTNLTNIVDWCLWHICWIEITLCLKINNLMSRVHVESQEQKKTMLFWPLNLLPGLTHICTSTYMGQTRQEVKRPKKHCFFLLLTFNVYSWHEVIYFEAQGDFYPTNMPKAPIYNVCQVCYKWWTWYQWLCEYSQIFWKNIMCISLYTVWASNIV